MISDAATERVVEPMGERCETCGRTLESQPPWLYSKRQRVVISEIARQRTGWSSRSSTVDQQDPGQHRKCQALLGEKVGANQRREPNTVNVAGESQLNPKLALRQPRMGKP